MDANHLTFKAISGDQIRLDRAGAIVRVTVVKNGEAKTWAAKRISQDPELGAVLEVGPSERLVIPDQELVHVQALMYAASKERGNLIAKAIPVAASLGVGLVVILITLRSCA